MLRDATPESVGLDPTPVARAVAQLHAAQEPDASGFPRVAGAVGIMALDGRVVARHASGWALRYADATRELPRAQWVPVRPDTVFDLASVSKLFTAVALVQLVEEGRVELADPVAAHLPEFAAAGKGAVTVRQLLTHTSGLAAWLPLWREHPDRPSRLRAVMEQPLDHPPGTTHVYSDLNLITAGLLVERLRGERLDHVVHHRITAPLGMHDTGYGPRDPGCTAATEYQQDPPRGLLRGTVHDENAWALGGVAGHAGVFSTADDLARFAQALLDGGVYAGRRVLAPEGVEALWTPGDDEPPRERALHPYGLGFELDQPWYMDALSGPRTAGHTGYTGTSLVIDVAHRSFAILLTNRVHPSRVRGSAAEVRRAWSRGLGEAMGLAPREGSD